MDFERVWGGFWEDFGRLLGGFWEGFGSLWRLCGGLAEFCYICVA